jgi:L-lactate dehydrogenase (cytochrome)
VTEFLPNHPGGARVIVKNGGQDATVRASGLALSRVPSLTSLPFRLQHVYMPIHPPGTIENSLDPSKSLGAIDPLTLPTKAKELTPDQKRVEEARKNLPSLGSMINLNDFEVSALS